MKLYHNLHNRLMTGSLAQFTVESHSASLGLNFNPGFFFFLTKAFSWIIFFNFLIFFLEYRIIKLQTKRIKLNLLFKLSFLNSNFTLTLGYLNPGLNNLALIIIIMIIKIIIIIIIITLFQCQCIKLNSQLIGDTFLSSGTNLLHDF